MRRPVLKTWGLHIALEIGHHGELPVGVSHLCLSRHGTFYPSCLSQTRYQAGLRARSREASAAANAKRTGAEGFFSLHLQRFALRRACCGQYREAYAAWIQRNHADFKSAIVLHADRIPSRHKGLVRHVVRIRHGSKVLDCTGEQRRRTEAPRDWGCARAHRTQPDGSLASRPRDGTWLALCMGGKCHSSSLDLERRASGLMTCNSRTDSTHHFNTIADLVIVVGFFRDPRDFKKIVGKGG